MSCRSSPTTLAAASSIASGSPSTRRQISDELACPVAVERSLCTGAGSLLEQADRVGLRQRCKR